MTNLLEEVLLATKKWIEGDISPHVKLVCVNIDNKELHYQIFIDDSKYEEDIYEYFNEVSTEVLSYFWQEFETEKIECIINNNPISSILCAGERVYTRTL